MSLDRMFVAVETHNTQAEEQPGQRNSDPKIDAQGGDAGASSEAKTTRGIFRGGGGGLSLINVRMMFGSPSKECQNFWASPMV